MHWHLWHWVTDCAHCPLERIKSGLSCYVWRQPVPLHNCKGVEGVFVAVYRMSSMNLTEAKGCEFLGILDRCTVPQHMEASKWLRGHRWFFRKVGSQTFSAQKTSSLETEASLLCLYMGNNYLKSNGPTLYHFKFVNTAFGARVPYWGGVFHLRVNKTFVCHFFHCWVLWPYISLEKDKRPNHTCHKLWTEICEIRLCLCLGFTL